MCRTNTWSKVIDGARPPRPHPPDARFFGTCRCCRSRAGEFTDNPTFQAPRFLARVKRCSVYYCPVSIAKTKVRKRREADLCGACGKNPCECKRPARKQHNDPVPTPDLNRKKRSAIRGKGMSASVSLGNGSRTHSCSGRLAGSARQNGISG
jgi:hypothetical protein